MGKITHGGSDTRLYATWSCMRGRCRNKGNKGYKNYGGRGISICPEWEDFSVFRAWAIANGYKENLTIDRIDMNGHYSPANCRWVTHREQNRNYRRNRFITYKGETLCAQDWADKLGINGSTILYRLKHGRSVEQALSTTYLRGPGELPRRHIEVMCVETGEIFYSADEAARRYGLHDGTHIFDAARGKRRTCAGYHWKLINEEDRRR